MPPSSTAASKRVAASGRERSHCAPCLARRPSTFCNLCALRALVPATFLIAALALAPAPAPAP
eukprot:9692293-Alexandrium_andersonii.AAC.1